MEKEVRVRYNFIVVGSGGTGTYFLKEFSRYLGSGVHAEELGTLTIIDGDSVEEKNLSRQAFTEDDIGLNKASVMADVLNTAFGCSWESYPEYLLKIELLQTIQKRSNTLFRKDIPVVLGCVDNHAARLVMEKYFDSEENCIYFDSANEYTTGEVVFSYKLNGVVISPVRSTLFPDVKKADLRSRTEISCEELNQVAPQHIATNMCCGNLLLTEVCNLLDGNPHPGFVAFDLATMSQEYVPINKVEKGAAV